MENIREILFGGQTFSWREEPSGVFASALNGRVYRIKSVEDASSDPFLYTYFDLDYDYEKARREIRAKDEVLRRAVDEVGEMRILKQDEWTTAISFILSQNNNIKRITKLYNAISMKYGRKIEESYYTFPTPDEMEAATEEELRSLGVGFRAPFIMDAIEKKDVFKEVNDLSFESALSKLESVKGIGPKVAQCILIFGCGRRDGFPIDTWMRKCLDQYYKDVPLSHFSPYEALCQQYLFSYMRNKPVN